MSAEKKHQADAAVIGGGIAGIVTALELLDRGRSVLLLDRAPREKFGGQAITAFGGMSLIGTPLQRLLGIKDSPELAFEDWRQTAGFTEREALPREWARMYCHRSEQFIYRWVRDKGVWFLPSVQWPERGFYRPGNSVPRYHIIWGTGFWLTTRLIELLLSHRNADKLKLCFGHRVAGLRKTNGAVNGCRGEIEGTGEEFTAGAPAVVMASGGIGGNIDRVRKLWPEELGEPPDDILVGGPPFCDGSGLDMAESAGAVITNLGYMWNYPEGISHTTPGYPGEGLRVMVPYSGLWMDYTGRRMGPEPIMAYFDTHHAVRIICGQKKKYSWHVSNWKIAKRELAMAGAEHNEFIRNRKFRDLVKMGLIGNPSLVKRMMSESDDFITADSLPELAGKMNALAGSDDVDLEAMEHDIRRYDDQIGRGMKFHNDDQLRRLAHVRMWGSDKMRTCKFQPILDPDALPLIAVRLRLLTRKSLGGIRTDLQSRVLDKDDEPVPGLYAAGEAAGFGGGGINGKNSLEGTFISNCILTGRVAGRSIAGEPEP